MFPVNKLSLCLALCVSTALAQGNSGNNGNGNGNGGGGGGGGGGAPPPDPAITYYAGNGDIMVMNEDGSNNTVVAPGPRYSTAPRFTADGQEIIFADTIGGQNGIWAVGVDGQGLRLVTPVHSTSLCDLTTSVVSTLDNIERIAFIDLDLPGGWVTDLYVVEIDGLSPSQCLLNTPLRHEADPAWSPAGDKISLRVGGGGIVILSLGVDAAGQLEVQGPEDPLTDIPGSPLDGSDANWSAWAHSHDWIAVCTITPDSHGNKDLWLVDLNSRTTPLRLTDTRGLEALPTFTPDDSALVFHAVVKGSYGTVRINVDGSGYSVIKKGAFRPHRRSF